jgi:colicin import membrane protein
MSSLMNAARTVGTGRAVVYSFGIHLAALAVMSFSLEFEPPTQPKQAASKNIVKAITVDQRKVEKELERLKSQDSKREQQRKAEERKLAELKKERQRLEREKNKEQQRLLDTAKQRKAEEAKKKKVEAERKDVERKVAEQKKRAAEEKQKAEQEQKRLAVEQEKAKERERQSKRQEELRAELAAEEQAEAATAQLARDQRELAEFEARITNAIENAFINPAPGQGISCVIRIRMTPTGDVVEAQVTRSSGNPVFDQRAEAAVLKAAPLPVPRDPRLFAMLKDIRITFEPEN